MNNCYLLGECAFCSPWQRRRLPGLALLILCFQNHGRDPIGWVVFLTAGCNGPVDFVFSKSWSRTERMHWPCCFGILKIMIPKHALIVSIAAEGLAPLILSIHQHPRNASRSVLLFMATKGGGVASPQGVLDNHKLEKRTRGLETWMVLT